MPVLDALIIARAAHFADRPVYDLAFRNWLMAFLTRWIETPQGAGAGAAKPAKSA